MLVFFGICHNRLKAVANELEDSDRVTKSKHLLTFWGHQVPGQVIMLSTTTQCIINVSIIMRVLFSLNFYCLSLSAFTPTKEEMCSACKTWALFVV